MWFSTNFNIIPVIHLCNKKINKYINFKKIPGTTGYLT